MNDWIVYLIDAGGYWGIGLLMVIENVFPPIPSELIMGIAGIRVGQGRLDLLPLLAVASVGSTIGNCFWYWVGWRFGFARLRPFVRRFGRVLTLDWRDVRRLNVVFRRFGPGIVFFFRFLPAGRTMVSLPAGLFKMGFARFLLWTFLGSVIWNVILAAAGIWLGRSIASIDDYLGPVSTGVFVLAIGGYLYRLYTWRPYRRA